MLYFALLFALLPFTAQGLPVPVISLNSNTLKEFEVVLQPGTPIFLTCEGQASVLWKTRVGLHKDYVSENVLTIKQSTPDHTGTYRCSYKNQADLFSEVHIYVKDSANTFTTPYDTTIVQREGSDCQLDCLPTDPTATEFSLRQRDGSPVLPEMNYIADPKRGIMIRNLQPSFNGEYVCTVKVDGVQRRSAVFDIIITQRVRSPPSLFTEMNEYVGLVGETLNISCKATNPDHACLVTWQDSSKQIQPAKKNVTSVSNLIHIESILTLPKVNMSDSGNLTCIGKNKFGQNNFTVSLRVVDTPYAHLTPVLKLDGHQYNNAVELKEGELLELSVLIDAYPSIKEMWWDTPRGQNISTYKEAFYRIPKSYRYMANFSLERIRADESGWYIFNARNAWVNASTQFKVHVYQKPTVVVKWKNDTLTCIAYGYPAPAIQWQQCEKLQSMADRCNNHHSSTASWRRLKLMDEFKPQMVESLLHRNEITSNMTTIQCVASNIAGEGHATFYFGEYHPEIWTSKIFITMLTGASVVSSLLLFLLGVCIYRCKQKPKYEIRWKIIETNEGNNYTYIDPHQLPYNNTKWEFPRDRLTFGQILGAGAFGKVVEATAYGLEKDEHVTRVAVKMLKSTAHSEEKEALMSELKILSHIGPHANIVNLLGACTHGGPVLLITEYCSHGDLLNFLRRRAQLLLNSILQDQCFSNFYKNLPVQESLPKWHSINSYQDMSCHRAKDCLQGFCSEGEKDPGELDIDDLLRFSNQVAQGMDFLASKNCIHRDVAARNVLVTDCFVAKICDFGLARDIMNDSNYVVRGNARLPVKWMSPESIFECIYTVQSDVWSYGILLWEIFSLGRSPYPDVAVDARFYKMIKGGFHMTQPDFAPTEMYTIMKMCWSLEPTQRPTFGKIVQLISKLLPEFNDQQYKNVEQELLQQTPPGHCVSAKAFEEPCDQMTSHNGEEQLLIQQNNYQLC